MKVLIVAKTRMSNISVCVGGIATESKRSLRLLPEKEYHQPANTPLAIGQVWEMKVTPVFDILPPHTEDVFVNQQQFLEMHTNLKSYLLETISPFMGEPEKLFGGAIKFSTSGRGYIDKENIPKYSTCFWIPDRPLILRSQNQGALYYEYEGTTKEVTYVGLEPPLGIIPSGTLVRMSLARWWRPDKAPKMPERCHLQLSGWYM